MLYLSSKNRVSISTWIPTRSLWDFENLEDTQSEANQFVARVFEEPKAQSPTKIYIIWQQIYELNGVGKHVGEPTSIGKSQLAYTVYTYAKR